MERAHERAHNRSDMARATRDNSSAANAHCYRMNTILMAIFLTTAILSGLGQEVYAHKYLQVHPGATSENPVEIPDPQISYAAYGNLTEKGQIDYFRFRAEEGDTIIAEILIPSIPRLDGFAPVLSLIAPGDDDPTTTKLWVGGDRETFFEPFTQTRYDRRQQLEVSAPMDGEYYLAVHSPENQTGKYVLSIGEKDVFSGNDVITLPYVWWKVRMFVELQASTVAIAAILVLSVAYGVFRILRRVRRVH